MELTAQIEVLIAHLKAEISVLEARLATALHMAEERLMQAGVDMPKAPLPQAPQAQDEPKQAPKPVNKVPHHVQHHAAPVQHEKTNVSPASSDFGASNA